MPELSSPVFIRHYIFDETLGRYSFENLSPGIYTVSENSVTGWNQTIPGNGVYEINLVDKDAINYDFGNHYGPVESVQKTHPIMPRNAHSFSRSQETDGSPGL